jgi:hypothetical protein
MVADGRAAALWAHGALCSAGMTSLKTPDIAR